MRYELGDSRKSGCGAESKCRHGSLAAAIQGISENICSWRAYRRLTRTGSWDERNLLVEHVGSEEAPIEGLASVRRSNGTCSFPAFRFHECLTRSEEKELVRRGKPLT
jgi:hypothetical protein